MLHSIIFWRKDQFEIRDLMAVQWKNHMINVEFDKSSSLKIRSFLQLLQNFQIHVQANHHREADISISDWFRRSGKRSGSEDPPAENIIQLYSRWWHKWHMEFGRLKRWRFTSSWLYKVSEMWNIILTSDVVANRTQNARNGIRISLPSSTNDWFPETR